MTPPRKQRGVALITAVLVVSIAVIAATSVLDSGHFAIQRASTLQDSEKAWGFAAGAEDWARTLLQRDAQTSDIDGLGEAWSQIQTLPIENGVISGQAIDAYSRFNLNNLGLADHSMALPNYPPGSDQPFTQYSKQLQIFEGLIRNIDGANLLIPSPQDLAEAIRDWIDEDQFPTGNGREDGDYLQQRIPHRAANRPMLSVTELKPILALLYAGTDGAAAKVYQLLAPHVTALPVKGVTPLNINTVTPELLLALDSTGAIPQMRSFIEERLEQPIDNLSQLTTRLNMTALDADPSIIVIRTQLFQLRMQAVVGNGRVALYSLIYRPNQGPAQVLARSTDTE